MSHCIKKHQILVRVMIGQDVPAVHRLLNQLGAPESTVEDVRTICSMAGSLERCIADHLVLVRRRLEAWLESKGVL